MDIREAASAIESILFVSGDPVSMRHLSQSIGITENETEEAKEYLKAQLQKGRGLVLLEKQGSVLLATRSENAPFIEASLRIEREGPLSRAALETLSIVAYRGPVSRAEVESIRGVNSTLSLRNLLLRGLVERSGDVSNGNKGARFSVSLQFLESIGISDISELPDFESLSQPEKVEKQADQEAGLV